MPDVDGGFQGCCCGNRGAEGIARRAEDFFCGGEGDAGTGGRGGGLLKDSEHEWERLPAPSPPFHLRNLLQEKINEDLVLDRCLLSL